jgi:hypothetical protein
MPTSDRRGGERGTTDGFGSKGMCSIRRAGILDICVCICCVCMWLLIVCGCLYGLWILYIMRTVIRYRCVVVYNNLFTLALSCPCLCPSPLFQSSYPPSHPRSCPSPRHCHLVLIPFSTLVTILVLLPFTYPSHLLVHRDSSYTLDIHPLTCCTCLLTHYARPLDSRPRPSYPRHIPVYLLLPGTTPDLSFTPKNCKSRVGIPEQLSTSTRKSRQLPTQATNDPIPQILQVNHLQSSQHQIHSATIRSYLLVCGNARQ